MLRTLHRFPLLASLLLLAGIILILDLLPSVGPPWVLLPVLAAVYLLARAVLDVTGS